MQIPVRSHSAEPRLLRKYWLAFLAFVVLLLGIASPFVLLMIKYPAKRSAELSQMGDWLGGTSAPLIGFVGFLMVLAAFMLQKDELNAQREELALTRDEFREQNTTLRMQRFENTFFNLLRFHHDIVEKLGHSGESSRQFFGRVYNALESRQQLDLDRKRQGVIVGLTDDQLFIRVSYPEVYLQHQGDLGHYFRNLYHILRFVHTSDIVTADQRQFYARVVRAQLSAYELVLLFYNALPPGAGYPKLKYLVDRYDLLQNLDHRLLRGTDHVKVYQEFAVAADPFAVGTNGAPAV
jgi:hypothetical protein